jgi:hypothetical protein
MEPVYPEHAALVAGLYVGFDSCSVPGGPSLLVPVEPGHSAFLSVTPSP